MEVKIGIQSVPRELVVETNETAGQIEQALKAAVADGGVFVLADDKGGKVLVPGGQDRLHRARRPETPPGRLRLQLCEAGPERKPGAAGQSARPSAAIRLRVGVG